jgi:hypothetical protein
VRKTPSITDLLGVLFALGSVVSIAPSGRAAALILPPPSTWTASAEVTGTIGYKDNLLLSSYAPESSAFAGAAADLMWWHLPQGPVDYVVYLNADGRRYFSGQAVDHEAFAALFGEWRRRLPDQGQFAFDLRGFYSDRVLDISDTAVQRVVAPIKVSGVNTGPVLRWNFSPRWWGNGPRSARKPPTPAPRTTTRRPKGARNWASKRANIGRRFLRPSAASALTFAVASTA